MADETTLRRQLIRIETDNQNVQQVRQHAQAIQRDLEAMRASVQAQGRDLGVTDERLSRYGDSARQVGRRIDDLAGDVERARDEIRQADRALDEMTEPRRVRVDTADIERARRESLERARLYGDVESRTRAITGAVGYLGGEGIERTVNIGAEFLAVNEAAGLLRQELPQLAENLDLNATKVGIFAVGVAAAGAAAVVAHDQIREWASMAQAAREETQGQIDALQNFYDFIGDATRNEIIDRQRQLVSEMDANRQLLSDLEALQARLEGGLDVGEDATRLDEAASGLVEALDSLGIQEFGLQDTKDAISEVRVELTAAQREFDLLALKLIDAETAAQYAAELREEATARQVESMEREASIRIQMANRTREQNQARLEQIELERQVYEAQQTALEELAPTSQSASDALDNVKTNLTLLEEEARILNEVLGPLVSELAGALGERVSTFAGTAAEAVAPQLDAAYQERVKREDEIARAAERANKYLETQAETESKRALTRQREREDFLLQRARDWNAHYRELAEIDRDYFDEVEDILADMAADEADINQERLDDLREYNLESRRLAEDHRDDLLRIQRDADRQMSRAAGQLDATALFEARQDLQDATEDAVKAYDKQQDRREEDFEYQLKLLERERDERLAAGEQALDDLRRQHQEERAVTQRTFAERRRLEDEDRRIRLQRQQEDWRIEDQQRLNHYLSQQGLTVQHWNTVGTITSNGMTAVRQIITSQFNALAADVNAQLTGALVPNVGGAVIGGAQNFEQAVYSIITDLGGGAG